MCDTLVCADETGTELHPNSAHFQVSGNRLTASDTTRDKDRDVLAYVRQDLLRENRRRDRADVTARFHSLDDERIGSRAHQLLRQSERWSKADELRAARLDAVDSAAGRKPASEHD